MAIQGFFFNAIKNGDTYDRVYNAEDFTKYLDKIVGSGVFANPSTNLQVVASSGMKVVIKAGQGWIDGHKIINTADLLINVNTADVVLNRIDSIVFYADYQSREMGIKIKEGVKAVTPKAPDLIRNTNIFEMCLAEITVSKQVTSITQSSIKDTRADSNKCGWVAGLIKELDTSTLFTQWETAYTEQFNSNFNNFMNWFNDIKSILSTIKSIKKYTKVYTTTSNSEKQISINIPEYVVETDILNVYISGFKLDKDLFTFTKETITLLYELDVIGTKVEIEVLKCVKLEEAPI